MLNEIDLSQDRLNRRLMAAIERGCQRRVQALLACGAKANLPCPAVHSWVGRDQWDTGITLPLAQLFTNEELSTRSPIATLLIAAGADVALCLYWLTTTETPPPFQVYCGLQLCEIVKATRWQAVYFRTIQAWLREVSVKLNRQPQPSQRWERKFVISVHQKLKTVSIDCRVVHQEAPWVTAELL